VTWEFREEMSKAISDADEALRLNPQTARDFFSRGNAFASKGVNDRAISGYSETIRIDPQYVRAYANRGGVWKNHR
jgi:tetratricopeptide (TPR) repeat protein